MATSVTSVTRRRYFCGAGVPSLGTTRPATDPPRFAVAGRPAAGLEVIDRKGLWVPLVQIRCPNSGLWASTGLRVDAEEWEPMRLPTRELVCPLCGVTHVWSKEDARIVTWA